MLIPLYEILIFSSTQAINTKKAPFMGWLGAVMLNGGIKKRSQ
jgi:hypothetical protein